MNIFETFKCSGQILSNSLCQFWNLKMIPLQILYLSSVSWKIIPRYFFSSKNIYFAQKEHIKKKFFWDFQVLRSKFMKFLHQFWNDKPIPLQILNRSSLSGHITSLWILSSHFCYFGWKDLINIQFWDFQLLWWKVAIFLMSFSKPQVSLSSNFASPFSFMKDNSSVFF